MAGAAHTGAGVREFHLSQPTRLVVGSGVAERTGRYASSYGMRALIVAGEGHARASGLLARVEAAARAEGMVTELLEGVGTNPGVAAVDAGALLARTWRAEVIVAVGGGSVIDVAKAIATSAVGEQRSFAEHLSGQRTAGLLVDAALPVVAVPTLPGSGSESNGTSVIIDENTGRKLSAHSELSSPRIALIDPDLAAEAPASLLGPGLVDAWCHALEAACSSRASIGSDALAEQALRTLHRLGPAPIDEPDRELRIRAIAEAWWATNLAGQALAHAGSIVTHPLAHPLSARVDARHGEAVAALEPAVLATFADRIASTGAIERLARWLGVRSPTNPDAAIRGVIGRLGSYCTLLEVTRTATDLGLVEQLAPAVVRDARASGSRGLVNLPGGEPTPEELFAVLDLARETGPTTSAKDLLAASGSAAAARNDA